MSFSCWYNVHSLPVRVCSSFAGVRHITITLALCALYACCPFPHSFSRRTAKWQKATYLVAHLNTLPSVPCLVLLTNAALHASLPARPLPALGPVRLGLHYVSRRCSGMPDPTARSFISRPTLVSQLHCPSPFCPAHPFPPIATIALQTLFTYRPHPHSLCFLCKPTLKLNYRQKRKQRQTKLHSKRTWLLVSCGIIKLHLPKRNIRAMLRQFARGPQRDGWRR